MHFNKPGRDPESRRGINQSSAMLALVAVQRLSPARLVSGEATRVNPERILAQMLFDKTVPTPQRPSGLCLSRVVLMLGNVFEFPLKYSLGLSYYTCM